MSRNGSISFSTALLMLLTLHAWPLMAEDEAEGLGSKLKVHGYLSQGFAISDGAQILGITEEGTAEYRTGALQVGYQMTEKDKFVIQLSHELLGESPSNELREDVELDWLYYQRNFTDATLIKVGRIPLPIGIYNQIKDVGTVLPFFRPSLGVYGDGAFTSDTIDGLVFSHAFAQDSPWGLGVDLYYGNWERIEQNGQGVDVADVDNAVGVQLWLNTPVQGLRFGLGANHADVSGGLVQPDLTVSEENVYLSLDGDFSRATFRAEMLETDNAGTHLDAFYAELLVKINGHLTIMANYDKREIQLTVPFVGTLERDLFDDYAIGVNYKFRSNLVVKLEHHWHEGFDVEDQPVNLLFGEPVDVNYAILSLSVHF